jgi:AcrR family transcriptional regulator
MRTKNVENNVKKKKGVLKAAATCFAVKGFHQTSMRDIAAQAKMSLGGIYRYFDSKHEIILSFIEEGNQESAEAFEILACSKNFKKTLLSLTKYMWQDLVNDNQLGINMEIFSEALRNKEVLKIVQQENSEEQLIAILKQSQLNKSIELTLSPDMAGMAIIGAVEKSAENYVVYPSFRKKDAMRYINEIVDLVIVETVN